MELFLLLGHAKKSCARAALSVEQTATARNEMRNVLVAGVRFGSGRVESSRVESSCVESGRVARFKRKVLVNIAERSWNAPFIIWRGGRGRKCGWQQALPGAKVEATCSSAPGNYLIRK